MTDTPALHIPPPAFLTDPALAPVLAALPEARIAGGAVRDTLAHRPVADIDLATPRPPDAVMQALTRAGIRAVPTGLDHGTVTAVSFGRGFEVTTLRRDVQTNGRHAVVAFTDDWRADAARRDFTINAMSMTRDGAVFDYFNGIADLHAGVLRFVGDPATRIAEDYLRILRFFRFLARDTATTPDPAAVAAIRAAVPGLAKLSAERVWHELTRILAAPDPRPAVALADTLGVLPAVLPEGADPARLDRIVATGAPADPLLRLAALLTGDPAALAERLRLSTAERDRLLALRTAPLADPTADDATLRRLLADTEPATLIDRIWLTGGTGPVWDSLRHRLATIRRPVFPLEGRDVLALGVPPGPRVGTLLRSVRRWWLDSGCQADAAACRAELARRIGAGQ
ncbi:MAG TPA: CCA tRNA nucleotidyltransferase [Acetobacteraceae bacterium]|jgi:poly(A) polymerase/tRNA nucleotidyltransferase (CCA-adding enzyme)